MLSNQFPNPSLPPSGRRARTCGLRARLKRWLFGNETEDDPDKSARPIRSQRVYRPAVRALEPRFVLNATAELSVLGQLLITGDAAADTVSLEVLPSGDVLVRDGSNAVIPITNHPGVATSPLNLSAVTANEIQIDLGGGDDVLDVQLPHAAINVNVVDAAGIDTVNLEFSTAGAIPGNHLIDVAADTITLNPPDTVIGFTNSNVRLTGNVIAGVAGANSQIAIGSGDWTIDGSLTLDGNLTFFSTGGAIDLSMATLTTNAAGVDATFLMVHPTTADVSIGQVDASGGQLIQNLLVTGSSSLTTTTNGIQLSGQFSAPNVTGAAQIDSPINASMIGIDSVGPMTVDGDLTSTSGPVVLSANQVLRVSGDINTVAAGTAGSVLLSGSMVQMVANDVVTFGGNIDVSAMTQIDGSVTFDSGNGNTATDAGDIDFFGGITSNDAINDRLTVNAQGGVSSIVTVHGPIGGFVGGSDLNDLTIRSQRIDVTDIGVTNGNVNLVAPDIRASGLLWRTTGSGDILVDGVLTLPTGNMQVDSSGSVRFTDDVVGQSTTTALSVTATSDIRFDATVSGFDDLAASTVGQLVFADNVVLQGDLDLAGAAGIEIFAATFTAVGDIAFQDDVFFRTGTQLTANQVRFEGVSHTNVSTITTINAPINDPVTAIGFVKSGAGTLVLTASNAFTVATQVDAGTLTVDGSIANGAGLVTVANGARLEGDGQVLADVLVQAGGTLAPGFSAGVQSGDQETSIHTRSVAFSPGGIFQFDISGSNAGVDQDQLVIDASNAADESVSINGAVLDLTISGSQPPANEYVLVSNDGVDSITGRFVSNSDINGNPLASPRVLNEGDEVLSSFGPGGVPAYITYFGGDGNDITIVTAGNVDVQSGGVTLVTRLGVDLEIRTGASLALAQAATPTIRTIAGLNNNDLTIVGNSGDDTVFVDVDGFVDPSGATINFDGNIRFDAGEGFGETDRLILFDSNTSTDDAPDSLAYSFSDAETGVINVDTVNASPNFNILFDGVESIDQSVFTSILSFDYTAADELIRVSEDTNVQNRTLITTSIAGVSGTSLSLVNATDAFSINGQDGDDQIELNGFGSGPSPMSAPITVDGQTGNDRIFVNSNLALGAGQVTGDFVASAETVTISANIDTTGGAADGSVLVTGGTAVVVDANAIVAVGDAVVDIDGNGGLINTGDGQLSSDFSGVGIDLHNATTVTLGDVRAVGTLRVGQSQNVTELVSQAVGSDLIVDRITASTSGEIDLSSAGNQIRLVESVLSGGDISIVDSDSDVNVTAVNSSGNDVMVTANGSILLDNTAITAAGAMVLLDARVGIEDIDPDDTLANISAGTISLTSGSQGIGQNSSDVDVLATQAINATTAAFNSDISLATRGGAFPVGLIDAGTGNVDLLADSIDDATIDSIADLVASGLQLAASTGIGVNERLELDSVQAIFATNDFGRNRS